QKTIAIEQLSSSVEAARNSAIKRVAAGRIFRAMYPRGNITCRLPGSEISLHTGRARSATRSRRGGQDALRGVNLREYVSPGQRSGGICSMGWVYGTV